MNRIHIILIFCLFCLSGCDFIETLKREYADWGSMMNAPEPQKSWFPPLFDGNLSFQDKIFNVIIMYRIDNTHVWGRFNYSNDFLNHLPMQLNSHISDIVKSARHERSMNRIGFHNNRIDYYFVEIDTRHNRIWLYFIDANENIIYFHNFFRSLGIDKEHLIKSGINIPEVPTD